MLDFIRNKLLQLKPTGSDGFEGLVGEVIVGVTGVSSRLAKSGRQFGIDGDSVYPEDAICFEAKRYSGKLKNSEINGKISELRIHKSTADLLWVLGSTASVAPQDILEAKKIAFSDGISVLILDWQSIGELPPLALALGMSKDRVIPFLNEALNLDKQNRDELKKALDYVIAQPNYNKLSEKLRSQFNAVELATANALKANRKWQQAVLSEKNEALNILGQPVTPLSQSRTVLSRNYIINQVEKEIDSSSNTIFLLGEEGCGKSWMAASLMNRFSGM